MEFSGPVAFWREEDYIGTFQFPEPTDVNRLWVDWLVLTRDEIDIRFFGLYLVALGFKRERRFSCCADENEFWMSRPPARIVARDSILGVKTFRRWPEERYI